MRLLLASFLVACVSLGCGGPQHGSDSDWSAEPETRTQHHRDPETLTATLPDVQETGPKALVGVRHDLMLSAGPHETRCSCLAVELGRPTDPMFFWAGGAPDIPGDALAIAVGARGVTCPGGDPDDRRRRPSISAVEQEGQDIFVEIEELADGRPLASGAVIPRPGAKGAVFVYPRKRNGLYGNGPAGRCRVR